MVDNIIYKSSSDGGTLLYMNALSPGDIASSYKSSSSSESDELMLIKFTFLSISSCRVYAGLICGRAVKYKLYNITLVLIIINTLT